MSSLKKRTLCLFLAFSLIVGATPVQAWIPTPQTTAVTVQYVISDLYSSFGLSVPADHVTKTVTDSTGGSPDGKYAAAVSYANSKGWLPSDIPAFTSTATVGFTLKLAMSMLGYKNLYSNLSPSLAETRDAVITHIVDSWLKADGITTANYQLTPSALDKVKTVVEHRYKIPQSSNAVGWDMYSKGKMEEAIYAFDIMTPISETHETYRSYKTNAYYGLGLIYSSHNYMMYERARDYLQRSIATDPKGAQGTVGGNAKKALDGLPDPIFSRENRPDDPATYQEFVALIHFYLSYAAQPGEVMSGNTADSKGAQPSAFAQGAVGLAAPGVRDYYDDIPSSWTDVVPRWWAAEYLCRMRGEYSWDLVNVAPYEDTFGMAAEQRMYLSRAVETGALKPYSVNSVRPNDPITRGEIYQIAQRMKNPTEPTFIPRPGGEKPKVHAYYTATLGSDTDLGVFDRVAGKVDMITFMTNFLEAPNEKLAGRLAKEGTQIIATSFVEPSASTTLRLDALAKVREIGAEAYFALSIYVGGENSAAVADHLISIINDDARLATFCNDLVIICNNYGYSGVNLGLENIEITAQQHTKLAAALSTALHRNNLKLIVTVGGVPTDIEMKNGFYDYPELSRHADYVQLLTYDSTAKNEYAETGEEGVQSSLVRIDRVVRYALFSIPPEKLLLSFGTYGIDYTLGTYTAENVTMEEARRRIAASTTTPRYDTDRYNGDDGPYVEYTDAVGAKHRIAFDNRDSFGKRMQIARDNGLGGVSYYWLGSEYADFFDALNDVYSVSLAQPVTQASGWAQTELQSAIDAGLIPEYLQNNYKNDITRAEFFDLIRMTAAKLGLDTSYDPSVTFPDSASPATLWAAKYKVTSVELTKPFMPYRALSRAEAAVTMTNAASKLLAIDTTTAPPTSYADQSSIASWASPSVNYASEIGVMKGVGTKGFDPNGRLAREQAMLMVYRFYNAMLDR